MVTYYMTPFYVYTFVDHHSRLRVYACTYMGGANYFHKRVEDSV